MKIKSMFKKIFHNKNSKLFGATFCILLGTIIIITKPWKDNKQIESSKAVKNKVDINKEVSNTSIKANSNETKEKPKSKVKNLPTNKKENINKTTTSKNINKDKNTNNKPNTNKDSLGNDKTDTKDKQKKTKKTENKKLTPTPHTFKSKNLGFSITFPASWHNKYKITEEKDELSVYFKSENTFGLLFTIAEKSDKFDESFYDCINKSLKCNGKTYFVGGSTDVGFQPDHPEFKTFRKMKSEVKSVLGTLK
ncbi:hypothetical protein HAHI6034_07805 [Hathewaya histolytica]|uniref:Uncharacterized protein n=1 Tax=Hathewaya histolytica TaxID=1498 RepID=A0A4U9QTH2_HATHI|nr:hypothetical protein [Hathewaya histolytica]VTQ81944.1 Uncharacterised protein [Hathewaya histolytica]